MRWDSFTPSIVRPSLLAAAACLVAVASLHAQRAEVRATGDPSLAAVADVGLWEVRAEGGAAIATSIPTDARVESFRILGDGWLLTAAEDDRLHVVTGTAARVAGVSSALPAPATLGALVAEPVPLLGARGESLAGLVWLEGDDHRSLAVHAARWTGSRWTAPVVVAAPGAGTQIALDAVRLDDGSWLAVWAGFDGVDDEITWSLFDGETWSAPAALTANEVPDVTPTLRVIDGRAVVAWSGYDGRDYRLHAASFDGAGWSAPHAFGGRGASLPRFAEVAAPFVVYRQAAPQRWVLAELGADGLPTRSAGVELGAERPIVLGSAEAGVMVSWPGSGRDSTGEAPAGKAAATLVPWDLALDP